MRPADLDHRPVADLIPYAQNSRTHSEAQIAQLAASITEFGFTNPILVDAKGGIIAGHGRVMAAKSLGLEQVPVLVLDHLTEAQRRAYVIADNKLALNAGWDDDLLRAELDALGAIEIDLGVLGFGEAELEAIQSGWKSDIELLEKHPENLDGIGVKITVTLDAENATHREAILNAVEQFCSTNAITAVVK
ncbi:MAG: ParB/Srx family N-terminal domain-containing protein [Alphaproteobacteria bacterium]